MTGYGDAAINARSYAPLMIALQLYGWPLPGTMPSMANRICWGIKIADGTLAWKHDNWDRDRDTAGGFTRPPLFADGKLMFIPENSPYIYQFSAAPQK